MLNTVFDASVFYPVEPHNKPREQMTLNSFYKEENQRQRLTQDQSAA